jgi:nitroreductase
MNRVYEVICKRRTIRRFIQKSVPEKILLQLVDAARFAPSACNIQPCEFIVINRPDRLAEVQKCVNWEAASHPSMRPESGKKPSAFIVILIDLIKRKKGGASDAAAAVENILLAACEQNLGGWWITALHRKKLKTYLRIPHHLHVDSVVAVGYPDEEPVYEEAENSLIPWEDPQGRMHVPKRRLADVCHMNGYFYPRR